MTQLNVHVTAEFDRALKRLMRLRGISAKSEAVRIAVQEAADRASRAARAKDLSRLLGAGNRAPSNPTPRFRAHDELWD